MNRRKASQSELVAIFRRMADLYEINGIKYKPAAYRKAANILEDSNVDIIEQHEKGGLKSLKAMPGIGSSFADKIEEYLSKGRVESFNELEEKTALREVITYFFSTKGIPLHKLKNESKKRSIIYSRHTKPAKELLILAGSADKAKKAIDKVSKWANSRELDYTIETVTKKWLELDRLQPKEKVRKAFYRGDPMVWSKTKKKWYVISPEGDWNEYADSEDKIEWFDE